MRNRRPDPTPPAARPGLHLTLWRIAAGLGLAVVVAAPLFAPVVELLTTPDAWSVWSEAGRLLLLARTSATLVAGTLALALPAGVLAAALLYRTDFSLARPLRGLIVLGMFVPLPLFASAWQASIGAGGWLASVVLPEAFAPSLGHWAPWPVGLGAAIAVHALAAFPWVVWIMGQGLRAVERPLEEDALTAAGPAGVLTRVSLARARPYVWVAACWVLLQTQGEIAITDVTQVPTFAEEAYTQIVAGDAAAVARALAASAPVVLLAWLLVLATIFHFRRVWIPLGSVEAPLHFLLGPSAMILAWTCAALLAAAALVPLASLVWKAGLHGAPARWAASVVGRHLATVARLRWQILASGMLEAAAVGAVAAGAGLVVAWLSEGSRGIRVATAALCALAWAEPAPVLGFGLKSITLALARHDPSGISAALLYDNPSLLPIAWAHFVRFLPFALILVWPAVRQIPAEVRASARLDGLSPGQKLMHVVAPLCRPAVGRAAVAVGVLSLGEVGAAKLVETPGAPTLALEVFYEMHYGLTNNLAALCLLLLGMVVLGTAVFAVLRARALGRSLDTRP